MSILLVKLIKRINAKDDFMLAENVTLSFLDLNFWGTNANGKARLRRRTAVKKQKATLSEYYQLIKRKRSLKLREWIPN